MNVTDEMIEAGANKWRSQTWGSVENEVRAIYLAMKALDTDRTDSPTHEALPPKRGGRAASGGKQAVD